MATVTLTATLSNGANSAAGNVDLAGNLPSQSALDAAMAVLVADGASPTQAHVTTANSAWSTYKTALSTQVTASSGNAVLSYDTAVYTTQQKINAMWRAVARALGVPGIGEF